MDSPDTSSTAAAAATPHSTAKTTVKKCSRQTVRHMRPTSEVAKRSSPQMAMVR
jgi:hypothetical protein